METGWKEIKRVYRSFSITSSKTVTVQQVFYRVVHWLYDLMPEDEAREFMMGVVDPDPIIDWETGAELGDPCPQHPDQTLSGFSPISPIHLECFECGR